MSKLNYVEDVFAEFMILYFNGQIPISAPESSAAVNFFSLVTNNSQITRNQASYILKILSKYQNQSELCGLSYQDLLENPNWKQDFRVLDQTKKIFIEQDDIGMLWICFKMPFQTKVIFDKEYFNVNDRFQGLNIWDNERKIRKLSFYDTNIIEIYEFAKKHQFEIDDTFLSIMAEVEEIWNHSLDIAQYSMVRDDHIHLINASEPSQRFFDEFKTNNFVNDAILAKSLGHPLNVPPKTLLEKIVSTDATFFWMKHLEKLMAITKELNGTVVFLLDRNTDHLDWLRKYKNICDSLGINCSETKVCFRAGKDENPELNNFIADNNYGGKIKDEKYLIFSHKPNKWLFNSKKDIKLIITNGLMPSSNHLVEGWLSSHPLVFYVTEFKPSKQKGTIIVEL